jgi:hypothetical protein
MNRKQRAHSPQLAAGLASEPNQIENPREVEDSLQLLQGASIADNEHIAGYRLVFTLQGKSHSSVFSAHIRIQKI